MATTPLKIIEEAKQLSPDERASVADALIKSLQKQDVAVEQKWIEEVSKTLQSLEINKRTSVYGI